MKSYVFGLLSGLLVFVFLVSMVEAKSNPPMIYRGAIDELNRVKVETTDSKKIDRLENAKKLLEQAPKDKGGFVLNAIKSIDLAINLIKQKKLMEADSNIESAIEHINKYIDGL